MEGKVRIGGQWGLAGVLVASTSGGRCDKPSCDKAKLPGGSLEKKKWVRDLVQ